MNKRDKNTVIKTNISDKSYQSDNISSSNKTVEKSNINNFAINQNLTYKEKDDNINLSIDKIKQSIEQRKYL